MSSRFNAVIRTPFGAVCLTTKNDYLIGVRLVTQLLSPKPASDAFTRDVVRQIKAYFSNPHATFNLAYSLPGTIFQKNIWQTMVSIPCGQVMTYGELAEKVASGARAVANACGANHLPLIVPCHRVVAKNGMGGFMQGDAQGLKIKRWLLQHEGVYAYESL